MFDFFEKHHDTDYTNSDGFADVGFKEYDLSESAMPLRISIRYPSGMYQTLEYKLQELPAMYTEADAFGVQWMSAEGVSQRFDGEVDPQGRHQLKFHVYESEP